MLEFKALKSGMQWNYVLGGDLNPVSGFYFPLFSMMFPGEFPLGQKMADSIGSKTAANCCKSTYMFCVGYIRSSLKSFAAFLGCS